MLVSFFKKTYFSYLLDFFPHEIVTVNWREIGGAKTKKKEGCSWNKRREKGEFGIKR